MMNNIWQTIIKEVELRIEAEPSLKDYLNNLILSKSDIKDAVDDILFFKHNDPACKYLSTPLLFYKGYQAVSAYRAANILWNDNRHTMALFIQNRSSEVFGVDIHPAASIDGSVMIDHATGVVIGETAVIKKNVSMLSAWPQIEMKSISEKLLMPLLNFIVFTTFPTIYAKKSNMPSLGLAHGACILFNKKIYEDISGHQLVKDSLFEDTELAKKWRSNNQISASISSNKTELIYLSAVSGIMHKILEFLLACFATSIAIAKVDPPETPVIIPSFDASSLAQNIPSSPETGIFWSK